MDVDDDVDVVRVADKKEDGGREGKVQVDCWEGDVRRFLAAATAFAEDDSKMTPLSSPSSSSTKTTESEASSMKRSVGRRSIGAGKLCCLQKRSFCFCAMVISSCSRMDSSVGLSDKTESS
jgi:hypothetical protein